MPHRALCLVTVAAMCCVSAVSGTAAAQSVIFSEGKHGTGYAPDIIKGWDHVGFESEGWMWESSPGYTYSGSFGMPLCWDPLTQTWVWVNNVSGVQYQHSVGSFIWNSDSKDSSRNLMSTRFWIDPGRAGDMAMFASAREGRPYPFWLMLPFRLSPAEQKGGNGYTCVGLVECCAELAGYNNGEGFIPNWVEALCSRIYFTSGEHPYLFTPQLLYDCMANRGAFSNAAIYLSGRIDPADFILTDPIGRRLGYTEETGLLNEIPGAFYSGQGADEQFLILDPIPGEYHMQLWGLGESALAILTTPAGDATFEGDLSAGQTRDLSLDVAPEPATLSLLALGSLALLRLRRRASS